MLLCKACKQDIYIQQREVKFKTVLDEPYYCWYCEEFKNYNEVEANK